MYAGFKENKIETYDSWILGNFFKSQTERFFEGSYGVVESLVDNYSYSFSVWLTLKPESTKMERVAKSVIDVMSESGGMISALRALLAPIGSLFSEFYFKLGVMSMLFRARSERDEPIDNLEGKDWVDPKAKKAAYRGKSIHYESIDLTET